MKFSLSERASVFYLFLVSCVALCLPGLFRLLNHNSTFPGFFSYFHLEMMENFTFSSFNAYHALLSFFPFDYLVFYVVHLVISLACVFLLYRLLFLLGFATERRFLVCVIFAVSPPFIFFVSFLNHFVMLFLLLLAGFNLLFFKGWPRYFSIFLLSLVAFFDIFSALVTISFLLVLFWFSQDRFTAVTAATVLLITLLVRPPLFLQFDFLPWYWFVSFFSDFGGLFGLGFFSVLLAVVGFFSSGPKHLTFARLFLVAFLAVSFFASSALIFLNVFVCFFAGLGFFSLLKRHWRVDFLHYLTVLVLCSGLLFSLLSYVDRVSVSLPDQSIVDALFWLEQNAPGEVVLSSAERSFWVSFAASKPFVDPRSPNFARSLNVSNSIFESRDLKFVSGVFSNHSISYLFLDSSLKAQLWPRDNTGLLLLLRNERFKKVYDRKGVEIWEFEELS